jgi:hypothetical protein
MYGNQSNTIEGIVSKVAASAIGAGKMVKLATDGRVTAVAAVADRAMYIALNDAAIGEIVDCQPLDPNTQVRIKAGTVTGTQNAGVAVYLAASADGLVNEVVTGATKVGYAEEQFVTGQLVLVRPIPAT